MIINEKFRILVDLYFSKFSDKKQAGTLRFIAKEINCSNGNGRAFISKLKDKKILVQVDGIYQNGRFYETYCVDRDKLIDLLFNVEKIEEFFKICIDNKNYIEKNIFSVIGVRS